MAALRRSAWAELRAAWWWRFARLRKRAKCPRCGWRRAEISFDNLTGRMARGCPVCSAVWLVEPLKGLDGKPLTLPRIAN